VAIVGAGIAGLTVAALLRRAGIQCHVFEQSPVLAEVGAGIQLSPNASRVLHQLGLAGHLREVAVQPAAIEMRRWNDDALLMRTELRECAEMFGAPYYTVHRAHLHSGLTGLLDEDMIHLDKRCVAVNGGELGIADGDTVVADLVIGADGIRSVVRQRFALDQPRYSGLAAYRGLVAAQHTAWPVDDPRVRIFLGPGRHCVAYPIDGGRLVSFVATAPAPDWQVESWQADGDVAELLAAYDGWHDDVRRLLAAAPTVSRWALHDRDALPRWTDGRVVLVGDAAHPMLPFGAQGAAQGIEDAAALAACLISSIPLTWYEKTRIERVTTVTEWVRGNARNHHFDDGEQQRERDRTADAHYGLAGQKWLYGYDAQLAVAKAVPAATAEVGGN
jgi:salicylate hydroxylase